MDCVFCKIINKELPADIIYEDNDFIVFKNIRPLASLHLLIVPKKHIVSINEIEEQDKEMTGQLLLIAKKVAQEQKVAFKKDQDKTGYKLVFNVGKGGGQEINHLHLHLLAGFKKEYPGMP